MTAGRDDERLTLTLLNQVYHCQRSIAVSSYQPGESATCRRMDGTIRGMFTHLNAPLDSGPGTSLLDHSAR
jgi:hypothetical protein